MLREQSRPSAIVNENKENFIENFIDFEERLPMGSDEDVQIWETHLTNKDEQRKMISFLAHIGGHEINTIVKNMLRKLLTDSVASSYNWEGKKGKKMLSSLILSDCIRKAALSSPNANKGTTEQEIITSVKNWLRHARRINSDQKKNPGVELTDI